MKPEDPVLFCPDTDPCREEGEPVPRSHILTLRSIWTLPSHLPEGFLNGFF
jgi:hypothetical protein